MPSKEVFLRGKVKWCKLIDKGDVQYQCWSTVLYLTPESYNQFMDMKKGSDTVDGLMNEIKRDEDGYFVTLKRKWTMKRKGVEIPTVPPFIIDKDEKPWPTDKIIGNGSDLTIKCEYFTFKPPFKTKKGSAIRVVSARVEDLVPFVPNRDLTDEQKEIAKGLGEPKRYF